MPRRPAPPNPPLPIDQVTQSAQTFDGIKICELGQDGEEWLIFGHVDDTTAIAVVNKLLVDEYIADPIEPDGVIINRRWATFRPHEEDCSDDCDEMCDECGKGEHNACDGTFCECRDHAHDGVCHCSCICEEEWDWWATYWNPGDHDGQPYPPSDGSYWSVTWVSV